MRKVRTDNMMIICPVCGDHPTLSYANSGVSDTYGFSINMFYDCECINKGDQFMVLTVSGDKIFWDMDSASLKLVTPRGYAVDLPEL